MNPSLSTQISLGLKFLLLGLALPLLLHRPVWGQEGCSEAEIKANIAELSLSFPNYKVPISPNNPVIKCGSESIKILAIIVQDKNIQPFVRNNAAIVLGRIGADSDKAISALTTVVQSKKDRPNVIQSAVFALGQTESNSEKVINALSVAIDNALSNYNDYWISMRAVEALYKIGTDSETAAKAISKHVLGFENLSEDKSNFAIYVLGWRGWRSTEAINTLIGIVNDNNASDEIRKNAFSALDELMSRLETKKHKLSTDKLGNLIDALENALKILKSYSEEQKEKIRKSLSEENKIFMRQQQEVYDRNIENFERDLLHLQREKQSRTTNSIFQNFGIGWLVHAVLWITLIFFYPKSPQIQAIFFWNPKVRKYLGLWYVDFALTWIPFLRSRLFAPFQESLLADAHLDNFDSNAYFPNSYVKLKQRTTDSQPIPEVIPEIQGQLILEGESGLGKSMFLQDLAKKSQRIVVYLPAKKCDKGVHEAIKDKLHGHVKEDPNFLKNLIYSGAMDICIDGLNEVTPDTRATITHFVESYFKGNIIMATQPLEWTPPSTAKTFILQPLQDQQIEEFLGSRVAILPQDAPLQGTEYEQACRDYLTKTLAQQQSNEEQIAIRRMLSNPMELTIVAQMLAEKKIPNLLKLQKEQYDMMAADYDRLYPTKQFPLKAFSETVYQMRLNDKYTIPPDDWQAELQCMERYKMVVSRQIKQKDKTETEWYLRHDKIQDFFIVQTFLDPENKNRLIEHISDSRFRGVYFLLATMLPFEVAKQLREDLIQYAADTKDHTVSDTFIQLFRSRQVTHV